MNTLRVSRESCPDRWRSPGREVPQDEPAGTEQNEAERHPPHTYKSHIPEEDPRCAERHNRKDRWRALSSRGHWGTSSLLKKREIQLPETSGIRDDVHFDETADVLRGQLPRQPFVDVFIDPDDEANGDGCTPEEESITFAVVAGQK